MRIMIENSVFTFITGFNIHALLWPSTSYFFKFGPLSCKGCTFMWLTEEPNSGPVAIQLPVPSTSQSNSVPRFDPEFGCVFLPLGLERSEHRRVFYKHKMYYLFCLFILSLVIQQVKESKVKEHSLL